MKVTKIANGAEIIWQIYWPSQPLSRVVFEDAKKHIVAYADYSPVHGAKLSMLKALRARLNKKYSVNLTADQIISLHDVVIKGKIISRYHLPRQIPTISKRYFAGESILDLSVAYDLPPLNLLHGILQARYDKKFLYQIFQTANKHADMSKLSRRDAVQFKLALLNDAETGFNNELIRRIAETKEREFVSRFQSLGIRIKTQDQLVTEQIKEFGRAIITPDILIMDTVFINGVQCHWIDYKNYIGTTVPFIANSNKKQAAKYYEKWGTGAIAYQQSYVNDLVVPNTLLLDASVL